MSRTNEFRLDYTPQERQQLLHDTPARQILYGGAAGGGKSKALRWDAIRFCLLNPGCQAYLFRRTRTELQRNHIQQIKVEMPPHLKIGEYSESRNAFEFHNGSALHMCFCERESDVNLYQGAEMHWVGVDEATHLTEYQLQYLKTRNRVGGWVPDPKAGWQLPRFVMASNPGGPGHSYLKSIFLDKAPAETLFYDDTMKNPTDPESEGWVSIFIPAKIRDNAYIDDDYEASFSGLSPELARALREGDWDAVVGQALHTLSREKHLLRPFAPPKHWTRFQVVDWGTARPFSVGWYTVSEGAELAAHGNWKARWLPSGAVIRYAEWYGWNGKTNQGARLPAQKVAKGIVQREDERGEIMDYRVDDTEMWADRGGRCVAEWFEEADPRLIMRKSKKDRKRNYSEILARLAGNSRFMEDGTEEEDPMFFITANCTHFWRTVPILTLDEVDPEKGPDTKQEDHCLDGLTPVYMPDGRYDIEDLPPEGLIWTPDGWSRFINLGMTSHRAEVWQLSLADGSEIVATPSHRFLCVDGQYRRLDELTYNDYIVCRDIPDFGVSAQWHNISAARHTGNVGVTIKDAASAFIELSGNIITAQFQRAGTFTTRTVAQITTTLRTLSCFPPASTCLSTPMNRSDLSTPSGTWRQGCAPPPSSGTARKRAGSGILSRAGRTVRCHHVLRMFAGSVARRVLRKPGSGGCVRPLASKGAFGVAILDITPLSQKRNVYNLHVPEVNAFVVDAGVVVHNCYDEVAYGLRSRPFISTEEDRYEQEWGAEARKALGKGMDPYATV